MLRRGRRYTLELQNGKRMTCTVLGRSRSGRVGSRQYAYKVQNVDLSYPTPVVVPWHAVTTFRDVTK